MQILAFKLSHGYIQKSKSGIENHWLQFSFIAIQSIKSMNIAQSDRDLVSNS